MKLRKRNRVYHRICRICRRRLTTPQSRKLGFGRKCQAKVPDRIKQERLERQGQMHFEFGIPRGPIDNA